jgi:hypothetical protein
LPKELLHPTDTKHGRKLHLCALARRISSQELPSQIIIKWSRYCLREVPPSILTTITVIVLNNRRRHTIESTS